MFTRVWDGLGLAGWACVFVLYLFCVFVFCIRLTITELTLANRHISYHKLRGTQWKCTHAAAMMTRSQPHESTQKRGWLYSRKVPVAPLDQKDARAFVVPPGGAEETGAIGHKYGWLSSPHTHPQETFYKNQSIATLKTSQTLMGYFEKKSI